MSVLPTPQQMTNRWKTRVQQSGGVWNDGVQACPVNPMQLATAQQPKLLANFNNAVNSGRWANKTNSVTPQQWKAQCALAQTKYAAGAATGEARFANFATKAIPVYQAMRAAVAGAGNDPIAKVTAALNIILAAGRKQGGNAFA